MNFLHQITVQETASRELQASSAKLLITIEGQSFFTGTEAFKKAGEVVACVSALKSCGLSEDHITLINVSAKVDSGFFNKSSAAKYELRIVCEALDRLGAVMSAIASQKNSNLSRIIWEYENLEEVKLQLIQEATVKAKRTAETISIALGVPLLGLHRMSYTVSGGEKNIGFPSDSDRNLKARSDDFAMMDIAEFDHLQLSHTTKLQIHLNADFQVDQFQTSDDAEM